MRLFDYSKLVDLKFDAETMQLIAKIHEYKGKQVLYLSQKPEELERLVEIAKIQSTESSNKIEGIMTTSTRMKQLINDKTTPHNRAEEEILGYRYVLNTIHENFMHIPIKDTFILQLHRDLFKYTDIPFAGKFKTTQNYIAEMHADGTSFIKFMPLEPYETPNAVKELCETFNQIIEKDMLDPIILIPIFIIDFLCIHPFNDGNGRLSRLLTTLLLYQNDYFVGRYISLERIIEKNKELYYSAIERSNLGWHENSNDVMPFVKHFLHILLVAYRDFEERVDLVGLKQKNIDIIRKAISKTLGKFTKSNIMELCPTLSKSTIENYLKVLVENKEITRYGNGKSTYYTKNY